MRFVESKRRARWGWILLGIGLVFLLCLGLCEFKPTPTTVKKTIVFEAN